MECIHPNIIFNDIVMSALGVAHLEFKHGASICSS
jgi:hypothetical protein